jgi:recombination protein RecA
VAKTTKTKTKEAKAGGEAMLVSGDIANDVLDSINEHLGEDGEDVAQMLGSHELSIKIKGVISTRCATIDAATGRGGVPLARLVILHGAESSGKTTLALQIAAETQALGGVVVYMDTEHKLDPEYAAKLGVNTEKLIIVQPSYLERAFKAMEGAIERAAEWRNRMGTSVPILIVLDSMNSTIAKSQFEGEWEDQHYAPQARVFSSALPKLIPKISKENVCLLWISQVRKKMGVMFGNDETIAGGEAPRFYASMVLKVTKIGTIKEGDGDKIANKVQVEPVKNQIAPPFVKAECVINYGKGFDQQQAVLSLAEKYGLVKKGKGKSNLYTLGTVTLGNGVKKAAAKLLDNPRLQQKLLEVIRKKGKW